MVNNSTSKWQLAIRDIPQSSTLWAMLFNIFVNGTDGGTECTGSKSVGDTKMSGAVDTLERRDAIQRVWSGCSGITF